MVTYVQNKLIKITIIVDISSLGFITHCVKRLKIVKRCSFCPLRWKHTHSLRACDVFHNPDSKCLFLFFHAWTVRRLCRTGINLGQRKPHKNTTNLERVLYLCLPLDWRWSDVLLASTFTRGKTLTFLNMQKICADVDAHNKLIMFTWRSRRIINELWRTPSESQRTDQNSSFFCALDVRDGMCDWAFNMFRVQACE